MSVACLVGFSIEGCDGLASGDGVMNLHERWSEVGLGGVDLR